MVTTEDRIYQGDYKKWIKFANSLKPAYRHPYQQCRSGICEGKSGRSGSTPVWSDGQQ
ncbi:SusD/RagB family nutrient-binding outer membrane lipoprotein [Bacteroides thetaiotaomicron]|nr:SusD/RagB family nutrient-binding outer membrane lipoprotein [Bacteroides thetaiotaomicron]